MQHSPGALYNQQTNIYFTWLFHILLCYGKLEKIQKIVMRLNEF